MKQVLLTSVGSLLLTINSFSALGNSTQIEQTHTKEGRYFFNFAALTNHFEYENDDVRKKLPDKITSRLKDYQVTGNESDYINYSFAMGYYLQDNLALRFNYTADIEIDFLGDFDFLCFDCFVKDDKRDSYDIEMDMYEFDAIYYPYQYQDTWSVYVLGGLAVHKIDAKVYKSKGDTVPYIQTNVAQSTEVTLGGKLGFGLQYDFSPNWGVKLGYSYFSYMSIDKTYINWEYRL
ncbi:outer membrane protein [Pseudoalteromonas tunicata]|uniref:Outer membrane protein beta-barrel domain-containing protein n=1 Tax=Pseudoalteromonas tunicata D2 TaxID=87626 RepID=A4CC03_9GAMM|nr:outer membrane beta-barrel protein [Pseudoalteromonas tunicata]ATC94438.1 hypothetical protein PTUN_a1870 [Pseudoalteromonas tunicata]AXT30170.1 hypothetical protein D1819_04685 [Pseudoalteromonas tunicata]EAR27890.1 hypothetical protein PTD2_18750 [Pseudoalteromonas tunicata D2]